MMDDGMGANNSLRSLSRKVEDEIKNTEKEHNASSPRRGDLKEVTIERLV
jgi:hypothetical protein